MCSHYEGIPSPQTYREVSRVEPPHDLGKLDMWPKYQGVFIRRPHETEPNDEAVPDREALLGRWGLVPWGLKPENEAKQLKLSTFNARSETVARSFTFGGAWHRGQHCIVPVQAFYEPDWRSGKAVATRFTRVDGQPMGIAGLWDRWKSPGGWTESFTLLTIAAGKHPLMKNYHRPGDEKRMVVILPEARYDEWLDAPEQGSMQFLAQYPADRLVAAAQVRTV